MAEITPLSDQRPSLIDAALPEWEWREYHQRLVRADLQAVWQACLTITLADLRVTRPLMILRGLGEKMQPHCTVLDHMPPQRPPHDLLMGLIFPTHGKLRDIVQPDSISALNAAQGPGLIRQAVVIRLQAVSGGTLLSTETRAIANDDAARRRFAIYWRLIRPASGLIQHDILRAIARQAEATPQIAA